MTVKWDYGDNTQCLDRPMSDLVPWVSLDAMISNATNISDAVAPIAAENSGIFLWTISGQAFNVSWRDPTLQHSPTTGINNTISDPKAIELPEANQWVIFVITTTQGVPHPIHLHGRAFLSSKSVLNCSSCVNNRATCQGTTSIFSPKVSGPSPKASPCKPVTHPDGTSPYYRLRVTEGIW